MASNKPKKKDNDKDIRSKLMVPLAVMGFLFIFGTAIVQALFPRFPASVRNILYLFGVISFVVYMIQIAFEKRTGKRENDAPEKQNKGKSKK